MYDPSTVSMVSPMTVEADEQLPTSPEAELAQQQTAEVMDRLGAMFSLENKFYPSPEDYLTTQIASDDNEVVSEGWRRRICDWIFEVVDHFSFEREVVSIALDYLDRCSSLITKQQGNITKKEFQLIAVTSLYMAIKVHGETDAVDGRRLKLRISAFEELSRGLFQVAQIEATERRIASALDWHLNPPTAAQYIAFFVQLLPEWESANGEPSHPSIASKLFEVSKYLSELACFKSFSTFHATPSSIACASLLCAIESISNSTPLPRHIYNLFIQRIADASSGDIVTSDVVFNMRKVLTNLAPAMFPRTRPRLVRVVSVLDNSESTTTTTKVEKHARDSPVCVSEAQRSPGKRARTC